MQIVLTISVWINAVNRTNMLLMYLEFVQVYVLKASLCKIRQKSVKQDVQQGLLKKHQDFVLRDVLEILRLLHMNQIGNVFINVKHLQKIFMLIILQIIVSVLPIALALSYLFLTQYQVTVFYFAHKVYIQKILILHVQVIV